MFSGCYCQNKGTSLVCMLQASQWICYFHKQWTNNNNIVRECDLWFICFSSSIDDVYFLSAAVHCGPGTLLVSRDMFGNHISRMDLWMKIQFRRWQRLHQMVPERFIGDNPVFFVCTNILLFDFDRSQPSFSKKLTVLKSFIQS